MKTSLTYLLLFCVFTCIAKAQNSFLTFPEDGSENMSSWKCIADDSVYYQTGVSLLYNSDNSQSVRISNLIKLNFEGEKEWQYIISDTTFAFDIVTMDFLVHSNKSIYLTGFKSNYFTTASGNTSLLETRIFLAKVNPDGGLEWLKYYNADGNLKTAADISEALDGGILVTGHAGNIVPAVAEREFDVILLKTNEEGDYLWHNTYNHWINDQGVQTLERTEGEYLISALGRVISSDYFNGRFFKSDESGNVLLEEINDGTATFDVDCAAPTFLITLDENIIIEDCIVTPYPETDVEGRIRKLDPNFDPIWTIDLFHEILCVKEKENGHIIGLGRYLYDEIEDLYPNDEDIWRVLTVVFEISPNGELLWSRFIGSQFSLWMDFRDMDVTSDGSIIMCGDAVLDGERKPLLLKLNPNGNLFQENDENTVIILEDGFHEMNLDINILGDGIVDGVIDIELVDMGLLIDTNPFTNQLKLQIPSSAQGLQIYNTTGQLIYAVDDVSESDVNISTSQWQSGIYFVVVKLEGRIMREKAVKK